MAVDHVAIRYHGLVESLIEGLELVADPIREAVPHGFAELCRELDLAVQLRDDCQPEPGFRILSSGGILLLGAERVA